MNLEVLDSEFEKQNAQWYASAKRQTRCFCLLVTSGLLGIIAGILILVEAPINKCQCDKLYQEAAQTSVPKDTCSCVEISFNGCCEFRYAILPALCQQTSDPERVCPDVSMYTDQDYVHSEALWGHFWTLNTDWIIGVIILPSGLLLFCMPCLFAVMQNARRRRAVNPHAAVSL